jgi:hypothetical protein
MQIHPNLIDIYELRRQGDFYIFSEIGGVDVFYYNSGSTKSNFPHQLSLNLCLFGDKYLKYVFTRVWESNDEKRVERYLWLLFKRIIKYPLFHHFKLDHRILDKNGRFDYILHRYYIRNYDSSNDNPIRYLQVDLPYTKDSSNFIFSFVEQEMDEIFMYDLIAIPRKIFEYSLTNIELQKAYVDIYSQENEFFYMRNNQIECSRDAMIYGIYFVFTHKKLSLVYFK